MAAALCSVINGGSYYEPHVVRQILNEQGSVVETKDPVLVRETVSQSTADYLKEAMFQTVENGTGGAAKVAGYQVGGKTGTAELDLRHPNHGLFIGYAPASDPEYAVAIRIANGYSSGNACLIANDIFKYMYNLADKDSILTGIASTDTSDTSND